MQQLLNFGFPEERLSFKDFFISICNYEAYRSIHHNSFDKLMLIGPSKSGKTLLSKLWQKKMDAISCSSFYDLIEHENIKAILLDDVEKIDQTETFNIYNYSIENSLPLLITSSDFPCCSLPDLESRLKSIRKVIIRQPDIQLAGLLLKKFFNDKDLKVKENIINYILENIERTYSSIHNIVEVINEDTKRHSMHINLYNIKKIMELVC